MKRLKKLVFAILCVAMLSSATLCAADAAVAEAEPSSHGTYRFAEVLSTTLDDNTIKTYTYGITEENNPGTDVVFINDVTSTSYRLELNDCLGASKTVKTEEGKYKALIVNGGNTYERYCFDNTGGTYVLTSFKLSDFSGRFNSNGTHTKTDKETGETHDFDFTKESDGNESHLVIISGGYVNFVAPDKNGYVKAYICRNPGEKTYFSIRFFGVEVGNGGVNGAELSELVIGDVDLNGFFDVADAVTIQKYIAGITTEMSKLQKRNADVDYDGKINVSDAVMIQKKIAGII